MLCNYGGLKRDRTTDLFRVKEALSRLSYKPRMRKVFYHPSQKGFKEEMLDFLLPKSYSYRCEKRERKADTRPA